MINEKSLKAVSESLFKTRFRKPLYNSYCFSNIPGTIEKLLLGTTARHALPADTYGDRKRECDILLLLFIDGFGWSFFKKYADRYPFLSRFLNEGLVSQLTSQFPSTTAPHVTCLSTGLDVGESGIYEWFYYDPNVDEVIAPLLFSFAGDKTHDTLRAKGIEPYDIYPKGTLFQQMKMRGAESFILQNMHIAHSTYSETFLMGANRLPYQTLDQALANVVELCDGKNEKPLFVYFYYGELDGVGHRSGPESPEYAACMDRIFGGLEQMFQRLDPKSKRLSMLFIADHGMIEVNPRRTVYLNEELPAILHLLKTNSKGKVIAPAGSCRDFFLHVKDEKLGEAVDMLSHFVRGKADVLLTSDLIDQGIFGRKKPGKEFMQRVGNVLILPYADEAVWWQERDRFTQPFHGVHGGMIPEEMEIPFLYLER